MNSLQKVCFIVAFASIQSYASCSNKDEGYELAELHFEGGFTISPVRDTVNIGDTIWVDAAIPDTLLEISLNKYYTIDSKYLAGLFLLKKLVNPTVTLSEQPGNAVSYNTTSEIGSLETPSSSFIRYNMQQEGLISKMRIAFVPQQTGVHTITTLPDYGPGGEGTLLPHIELGPGGSGKRQIAMLRAIHFRFNESGSGYHIFKQHCVALIEKGEHPSNTYIERDGAYTFVVR